MNAWNLFFRQRYHACMMFDSDSDSDSDSTVREMGWRGVACLSMVLW